MIEQLGDLRGVMFTLTSLGGTAIASGNLVQGRRDLERALQLGRHLGLSREVGEVLWMLGNLALSEGKWEEAAQYLNEARSYGWEGAQYALALRELLAGRPEAACELLLPVPDPLPILPGYPFQLLAWAEIELGHEAEAEALLEESIRRTTILHEEDRWFLDPHLFQARLRARQKRWAEAEALLEGVLASYRPEFNGDIKAIALYFYGRLHSEKGEPDLARQRWEAALVILHRQGERLYAEQIERLLAQ